MAISKIGSKALVDCSVAAVDIEDNSITSAKLAGSIANAKLANSSITVNGTSVSLGASGSIPAVSWQSVKTNSDSPVTLVAGNGYFMDTTSGAITATLPGSPSAGDTIAIKDYAGTFNTNNLTIGRNGNNIQGVANDSLISTNRASLTLVYVDATKGWLYAVESNVTDFGPTFISATGGTITESGDFKIHTFTGDGCFVVSQIGTNGGPTTVDYLVVAGGGGGASGQNNNVSGGGGGAGGFRESHSTPVSGCYTASPLATPTALPVSATTYPITVGGGGAGATAPNSSGSNGNNSVFSTITSTAGGAGGGHRGLAGNTGGSGGGGGTGTGPEAGPGGGGAGNTPPTSPSQGFAGGNAFNGCTDTGGTINRAGGGGGGASALGGNAVSPSPSSALGGAGGAGATTSISASPTAYAGGGGGGSNFGSCSRGAGGLGGGGNGGCGLPNSSIPGTYGKVGTSNTGGGGGGGAMGTSGPICTANGGNGGKGIVIIRYKYQ